MSNRSIYHRNSIPYTLLGDAIQNSWMLLHYLHKGYERQKCTSWKGHWLYWKPCLLCTIPAFWGIKLFSQQSTRSLWAPYIGPLLSRPIVILMLYYINAINISKTRSELIFLWNSQSPTDIGMNTISQSRNVSLVTGYLSFILIGGEVFY